MSHVIMPKKLAQVLMESSMQHLDAGGNVNPASNPTSGVQNTASSYMPNLPQTPSIGGLSSQETGLLTGTAPGSWLNPSQLAGQMLNPMMNTYQAQAPGISTQNFMPSIAAQTTNLSNVQSQQQNLAQQLLAQSQGQGPGQALVAQQAGNNASQQAALMASQRGASANAGLIGRQAAQAGAAGNQQVLNTQAALSLQSQGALAQQQQAMANQAIQAQSVLQGAQAAQNTALTQGSLGAQQINANTSGQNAATMGGLIGGGLGGISSAISSFLAKGGTVKKMADGGEIDPYQVGAEAAPVGAPINDVLAVGNYPTPAAPNMLNPWQSNEQQESQLAQTISGQGSKSGGKSGGMSGGMSLAALMACGGTTPGQMLAGGNVPGKAKVKGDSESNDTVPTMLSPGEDVIPRSITQLPEKEMEQKAVEFLRHLHKNKGGYKAVVESRKKRV